MRKLARALTAALMAVLVCLTVGCDSESRHSGSYNEGDGSSVSPNLSSDADAGQNDTYGVDSLAENDTQSVGTDVAAGSSDTGEDGPCDKTINPLKLGTWQGTDKDGNVTQSTITPSKHCGYIKISGAGSYSAEVLVFQSTTPEVTAMLYIPGLNPTFIKRISP